MAFAGRSCGLGHDKQKMRDETSFLERRFMFNGVMDGPLFLACICSLFSGTPCLSFDFRPLFFEKMEYLRNMILQSLVGLVRQH